MDAPTARAVPVWLIGILVAVSLVLAGGVAVMAVKSHQRAVESQERAAQSAQAKIAAEQAALSQAADDEAERVQAAADEDARVQAAEKAAKVTAAEGRAAKKAAKVKAAEERAARKQAAKAKAAREQAAMEEAAKKRADSRHMLTGEIAVPDIKGALVTQIGGYPGQPLSDFSERQLNKLDRLLDSLKHGRTFLCPGGSGGGYGDLVVGGRVTIQDGDGTVLATTTLIAGTLDRHGCTFTFLAQLPDADFYQVTVTDRGTRTLSRADLAANNWQVSARL